MISYVPETRTFYLETDHTSYVIRILEDGSVVHSYYGARIPREDLSDYNFFRVTSFGPVSPGLPEAVSVETMLLEYPTAGRGDYRTPAVSVLGADGCCVNELRCVCQEILPGKPRMEGLPQMDRNTQEVQTLKLVLQDGVSGFEAELYYTAFEKADVISRRAVIRSTAKEPILLKAAASASLDLETADYDMITLQGSWARERYVQRHPLYHGVSAIESRRGASGHQLNPFAALAEKNADEDQGRVYGVSLIYSGDFRLTAEVDSYGAARLQIGLNPETFSWQLNPGESFETPEALLTFTEAGLNGMSQNFHRACRTHLGKCADNLPHPILINSWEAMYFDFNQEKMVNFIRDCRGLGIDTVVMDDGWFGHRDDDRSSLGDWFLYEKKLPRGLGAIVDACRENGMKFGIWFEPEMISRDSQLFRAHPDWCIHTRSRQPLEGRNQLILDMSREEVVDGIFDQMVKILDAFDISYVKWDMNRNMTDAGSELYRGLRQGELRHRYMLGVYRLISRLEQRYPTLFFEGCSGGGGRFDFGMLYYMPQIWTSDDTDAVERMKIQYGTSFVYPPSAMTAHVSACPNHQTGRTTPFETRGNVAQMCSFGYEFDPGKLTEAEKEAIRQQIQQHRRMEDLVNSGTFYRLRSPFQTDFCSWELVSEDRKRGWVMFAFRAVIPQAPVQYLKLKGLDPQTRYTIPQLGIARSGATLMKVGIAFAQPQQDYASLTFDLIGE